MRAGAAEDVAHTPLPEKGSPPDGRRPPLSFLSSMVRVMAENQAGEVDSFRPWHECPGLYGGRLGGLEQRTAVEGRPDDTAPTSVQTDVEELSAWSAQPLFSAPAPASLIAAVSAELDASNDRHADAVQGVMSGSAEWSAPTLPASGSSPPLLVAAHSGQWNRTRHGSNALRSGVWLWVLSSWLLLGQGWREACRSSGQVGRTMIFGWTHWSSVI